MVLRGKKNKPATSHTTPSHPLPFLFAQATFKQLGEQKLMLLVKPLPFVSSPLPPHTSPPLW